MAAGIPAFLDTVDLGRADRVMLHTEYMHVHILADEVAGSWALTGLFDFEPALHGHPEYDLAAAGIFLGRGDRTVWREFLDGYGYRDTSGLARRVLAYCLLHRFANLPWYLREVSAPGVTNLEDLAEHWFGVDDDSAG